MTQGFFMLRSLYAALLAGLIGLTLMGSGYALTLPCQGINTNLVTYQQGNEVWVSYVFVYSGGMGSQKGCGTINSLSVNQLQSSALTTAPLVLLAKPSYYCASAKVGTLGGTFQYNKIYSANLVFETDNVSCYVPFSFQTPLPPTLVSLGVPAVGSISSTGAVITWTPAATSGDFTSGLAYHVEVYRPNTPYKPVYSSGQIDSDDSLSVTATELAANTQYTVKVTADDPDAVPSRIYSTTSFFTGTTSLTSPGTPVITDRTSTDATITWGASTSGDNDSSIGYTVEIYLASTVDERTTLPVYTATVNPGDPLLSVKATGLIPDTNYLVKIHAQDTASGDASPKSFNTFSTLAFLTAPVVNQPKTTASSAATITPASATVTWSAATGDSTSANVSYSAAIYSGDSATGTPVNTVPVNAGSSLTATFSNLLDANTSYTVVVSAIDSNASNSPMLSKPVTFTSAQAILALPAMTASSAISTPTSSSATVTWTAATGDDPSNITYHVSVSPNTSNDIFITPLIVRPGMPLSSVISNLAPNTPYTISVQAVDPNSSNNPTFVGDQCPTGVCQTVTFTTAALTAITAPGTPAISKRTADSATVTWTAATIGGKIDTSAAYKVTLYQIKKDGSSASASGSIITPNLNNPLSATITGLSSDTQYSVSVTATDERANPTFAISQSTLFTTLAHLTAPVVSQTVNTTSNPTATTTTPPANATITWTAATGDSNSAHVSYSAAIYFGKTITGGTLPVQVVPVPASFVPAAGLISATFTGLNANAYYTVVVSAIDTNSDNAAGDGLMSNSVTFTSAQAILALPSMTASSAISNPTQNSATVTWTAATGDDPSNITYHVSVSPNTSNDIFITPSIVTPGTSLSSVISNLAPNTPYTISVQAVDPNSSNNPTFVGDQCPTGVCQTVTFTTASGPAITAPTIATPISVTSSTNVTVTWAASTGDSVTSNISYSAAVFDSNNKQVGNSVTVASGALLSASFTNLNPDTPYTVIVTASDPTSSNKTITATALFRTLAILTAPVVNQPKTTASSAATITPASATVTWSAATGDSKSANISYSAAIYAGDSATGTPVSTVLVNAGSLRTATFTGLDANAPYTVVVSAIDANSDNATSSAPLASQPVPFTSAKAILDLPAIPAISNPTSSSATVTWLHATGDDPGNITYYVSVSSNATISVGNTVVPNGIVPASPVNLSGLNPNEKYTVTVQAVDKYSSNSPSALTTCPTSNSACQTVTFTTAALSAITAPGTPAISSITSDSATVTWDASTLNGKIDPNATYTVTVYLVNKDDSLTIASSPTIKPNPTDNLSTKITGLSADTQYAVSVTADDASAGSSSPASQSTPFSTLAILTAPVVSQKVNTTSNPTAAATPASATVTWTAATGDSKSANISYSVAVYSGSSVTDNPVHTITTSLLTATFSNLLDANTSYTVVVSAIDENSDNATSSRS